MTLTEAVAENRKTLRAAMTVLPLGIGQKALVLTIIDRHFELQAAIVARLEQLEKGASHGEHPEG